MPRMRPQSTRPDCEHAEIDRPVASRISRSGRDANPGIIRLCRSNTRSCLSGRRNRWVSGPRGCGGVLSLRMIYFLLGRLLTVAVLRFRSDAG
jgi:hypothetical protein